MCENCVKLLLFQVTSYVLLFLAQLDTYISYELASHVVSILFLTVLLLLVPYAGHVGAPLPCNLIKLVDVPEKNYFASKGEGEVSCTISKKLYRLCMSAYTVPR